MIQETITVKLVSTLEQTIFEYGSLIFTNTSEIFLGIFMTFYSCVVMCDIAKKTVIKQKYDLVDILKPVVICSFLTAILSTNIFIEEGLVKPVYNLSVNLAAKIASLTTNQEVDGMLGMLSLIDSRLNQVVFKPCLVIAQNIGYLEMHLYVGVWVLQILFLFLWSLFVFLMIEAIFRFMTFYCISPLLIIALVFKKSRPVGTAGLKSLLNGFLGIFMASVAMGMTIALMAGSDYAIIDVSNSVKKDFIFSADYFGLILLSLISIAFHLKAPKIAANMAMIDDGPGVAAAVAGLGTAAVMSGKGMVGRMGGRAGHAGIGAIGSAVSGARNASISGTNALGRGFSSVAESLYTKMTGK